MQSNPIVWIFPGFKISRGPTILVILQIARRRLTNKKTLEQKIVSQQVCPRPEILSIPTKLFDLDILRPDVVESLGRNDIADAFRWEKSGLDGVRDDRMRQCDVETVML